MNKKIYKNKTNKKCEAGIGISNSLGQPQIIRCENKAKWMADSGVKNIPILLCDECLIKKEKS